MKDLNFYLPQRYATNFSTGIKMLHRIANLLHETIIAYEATFLQSCI